jgi:rubrerythrin
MTEEKTTTIGTEKSYGKLTFRDLFAASIKAELSAHNLYGTLAKAFSHLPIISKFWEGMMEDEYSHFSTMKTLLDNLTESQKSEHVDMPFQWDGSKFESMIPRDMSEIKNLDDAYELAHQLESSEINRLFEFLSTRFISQEERRKILVGTVRGHHHKLMEFGKETQGRDFKRSIRTWVDRDVTPTNSTN